MIYNYLELDSLSKWPQEKRVLLLKLLDTSNNELYKSCGEFAFKNLPLSF